MTSIPEVPAERIAWESGTSESAFLLAQAGGDGKAKETREDEKEATRRARSHLDLLQLVGIPGDEDCQRASSVS